MSRQLKDRLWSEYPLGTRAYAFNGGYWVRVEGGWKWFNGDVFPTPGADAIGACVQLPDEIEATNRSGISIVKRSVWSAVTASYSIVEGRLLPFQEGVALFNSKRRWWLSYSYDRNTGSFKTKKEAVGWYVRGGR